jgi:adenine-specific DNA methylase
VEIVRWLGDLLENQPKNLRYVTKTVRSPLEEFDKRVQNNLKGLLKPNASLIPASVLFGNAQNLPLPAESVDLIVTSPPYASNAIDYMRAHKFSLVWLGYSIGELSDWRKKYIGGEVVVSSLFEELPAYATAVVADVSRLDAKKGQVLQRYYSEMKRVLNEMYRVLKPGKVAVVVVGNSDLRGRDTETQNCLADIGRAIGFDVPAIGVRNLDRNRRMLPAGETIDRESQIQKRMHQEFVIGYYKPN